MHKALSNVKYLWLISELDPKIDIFDIIKMHVGLILNTTQKLDIWGCDGQNFNNRCLHYLKLILMFCKLTS